MENYSDIIERMREERNELFLNYVEEQGRITPKYFGVECRLHYDFIRFTIYLNYKGKVALEEKLYPLLNKIRSMKTCEPQRYILPPPKDKRKKGYDEVKVYRFQYEGTEYELGIAKCSKSYLLPYILTIHDPDQKILLFLKPYLESYFSYHVKEIEYTFDFIHDDPDTVKNFIIQHINIPWQGKHFSLDNCETYYFANPRIAKGKGGRVYEKILADGSISTRMEIVIKHEILKGKGINKIEDLFSETTSTVLNYIRFKDFNFDKLISSCKKEGYSESEIIETVSSVKNRIRNGRLHQVNKDYLETFRTYQSESFLSESQYNNHFKQNLFNQSFLSQDTIFLSSRLMTDNLI